MIFVTIGTQKQQFDRIIKLIENSNVLKDEEIIIQVGHTKYNSSNKNIQITDFLDDDKFKEYIKNCKYIICHGGVGTIFTALESEKKILVVPRLKKYHEHKNDHQLEVSTELEKEGYILVYKEGDNFDELLSQIKYREFKKYVKDESFLEKIKKEI